jgi:hypothetical protein
MKDPWEKAYVYGRTEDIYGQRSNGKVAHIVMFNKFVDDTLCGAVAARFSRTAKPYPVCKNCLRTKRAKELGL